MEREDCERVELCDRYSFFFRTQLQSVERVENYSLVRIKKEEGPEYFSFGTFDLHTQRVWTHTRPSAYRKMQFHVFASSLISAESHGVSSASPGSRKRERERERQRFICTQRQIRPIFFNGKNRKAFGEGNVRNGTFCRILAFAGFSYFRK